MGNISAKVFAALLGFFLWALLQDYFVKSNYNQNDYARVSFAIIVPLIASVFVFIFASYGKGSTSDTFHYCYTTLFQKGWTNPLVLISAAFFLAIPYYFYPLIMKVDFKYIGLISVLLTSLLVLSGMFLTFKNNNPVLIWNFELRQFIGAFVAIAGVLIMKWDSILNWFKS